ncbi:MAG: hypothetical protein MRY21_07000 [Simkaniaceae bacterium]|nr:hypothetical protein [Simkaniaceae bacterium]
MAVANVASVLLPGILTKPTLVDFNETTTVADALRAAVLQNAHLNAIRERDPTPYFSGVEINGRVYPLTARVEEIQAAQKGHLRATIGVTPTLPEPTLLEKLGKTISSFLGL